MKKIYNLLLIVVALFMITGCSGTTKSTASTSSTDENFLAESDVEELLDKFGLYSTVCTYYHNGMVDIYNNGYSDANKTYTAILNVSDDKVRKIKCGDYYNQSVYDDIVGYYQGTYGICDDLYTPKGILYEDVNNVYKTMFDGNATKDGFNLENGVVTYDFVNNTYLDIKCSGCDGYSEDAVLINEVKSVDENNNKLEVNVYFGHVSFETNDDFTMHYATINGNTIENSSVEGLHDEIVENYLDTIDIYKIVFKKYNGNYIFSSLTKNN